MFDNIRPVVRQVSSFLSVTSPTPPRTCKTFTDMLKYPFFSTWKRAVYEQFDKNADIAAVSIPFPESTLPPDTQVLPSLLAPSAKPDVDHPNLHEFKV